MKIPSIILFILLGMMGALARFFYQDEDFTFGKMAKSLYMGVMVATLTYFIAQYLNLEPSLSYALASGSGVVAREVIGFIVVNITDIAKPIRDVIVSKLKR